jgi:hypothetical protein
MRTLLALVFLTPAALSQSVLYSVDGSEHSAFGRSVDVIGDVDGDGIDDLVVGAPSLAGGGHLNGGCFVLSGASGALLHSVVAGPTSTFMGHRVSRLGDVNGDGVPDYYALASEHFATSSQFGRLSVRSGVDGSQLHAFEGEFFFSSPADDLGDVDGDGVSDYIVGSPGYPQASYAGRVWVRSGADGSAIYTYTGSGSHGSLGRAVAGVGDLDGDGRGDFAYSSIAGSEYWVEIRSGATGNLIHVLKEPSSSYQFGNSLDSAGDVDADGVPDLLIGRRQQGLVAGELHVHSGSTGLRLYTVQGLCQGFLAPEEYFPEQAAALGDLNGDGHGDFGAVGLEGHYARLFSGLDGSVLADLHLPPPESTVASFLSITGASDLDLDGRPEIVVGQHNYTSPGASFPHKGRLWVFDAFEVKEVGTALAFGDGSGAACPCGNTGQPGSGCANGTGSGAVLSAWGSRSVAFDDKLWFAGEHLVPATQTLLIASPESLAGGLGVPFADGLLACGAQTKRVWPQAACTSGLAAWGTGLRDQGGWNAGDARVFQVWYRDVTGPCGQGSNLSNAVRISFVP